MFLGLANDASVVVLPDTGELSPKSWSFERVSAVSQRSPGVESGPARNCSRSVSNIRCGVWGGGHLAAGKTRRNGVKKVVDASEAALGAGRDRDAYRARDDSATRPVDDSAAIRADGEANELRCRAQS